MRQGTSVVVFTVAMVALAALPASAAKTAHMERSLAAGTIRMVEADLSVHDLNVRVAPGETIEVTVDLRAGSTKRLEEIRPKIEVNDHVLKIVAPKHHHHWGWGSSGTHAAITIVMPPGRELDVDTASGDVRLDGDLGANFEVDTASGDVTVEGAFAQGEIDTASGDVRLKLDKPAEGLDIETASGDVTVEGGAAKAHLETASGDVRVDGLTGPAEVDTASGDVTLQWPEVPAGADAEIETASGDVRIVLPPTAAVAGTVTTHSGDLRSDFPSSRSGHGRILELRSDRPALRLEISTSSGDVSIEKVGS